MRIKKTLTLNNGWKIKYDADYTEHLKTMFGENFAKAVYVKTYGEAFCKNHRNILTKDCLYVLTNDNKIISLSGTDGGNLAISERWLEVKENG